MGKIIHQLIDRANDYLNRMLGISFKVDEDSHLSLRMPYYLKAGCDFSICSLDEYKRLLVIPADVTDGSTLSKRMVDIYSRVGIRPVLLLDNIDSVRRKVLISNRIDFIVPGKQIYLPSMAIILSERGMAMAKSGETLSPSAQVLLLYHLQNESLEGKIISEIAKLFPYSVKTISSAIKELVHVGVCTTDGDNSGKELHFVGKNEIWKTAYPLLTSPIKEILFCNTVEQIPSRFRYTTYDSALSYYTFISDNGVKAFAVYKNDDVIKRLKNDGTLNKVEGLYRIELWKYNPALLAKNNYVDALSLALCYKDSDDERVTSEIEKLVDKICKA